MCTSASVGYVCNDTRTKCDFLYALIFVFTILVKIDCVLCNL